MIIRTLKRIAITVVVLYVGILLFLMANETSLVYPGSKYPRGNWTPTDFEFEEVQFLSADGTRLVGWYLPPPEIQEAPSGESAADEKPTGDSVSPEDGRPIETILLCHGNAENIAQSAGYMGNMLRTSLNAELFVFDYRGFGKSEGVPAEQGVLQDAEAALKWLNEKTGMSPAEIILVGHSIGGGPAVHLASKHGAKALVLQRTFNALTEPAANQYPWLPIRYVMRNQFRSVDWIKEFHGPLFQSHGTADRLIPIHMGRELFDAAPTTKKRFFAVDGMTHWDALPEEYWRQLARFIDRL